MSDSCTKSPFACIILVVSVTTLHAGESERGRQLRDQLANTVDFGGIDDPRCSLNEVLDYLSKRYCLSFDINKEAFKKAGCKDEIGIFEIAKSKSIPPTKAKLGTVLRKILKRLPHSAAYLIRGDVIEITTTEAILKELFPDRPPFRR